MPIQGPVDGLVQQLLDKLESLSRRLNKTVVITSGKRSGDVNASAHNSGIAADFYVAGMNSIALADEIVDEGFTGVGEYYKADSTEERFAHADIRGLPGSERSGAYGPGGAKSAPLCWYRIGEAYTYGTRKSGRRCPRRNAQGMADVISGVDLDSCDAEGLQLLAGVGTCINKTGEILLVYGPNSSGTPQNRDNALYQLPSNRKTPPGWDCDGIYVPNDRIANQQAFPDKPGPVAVKYGLGPLDTTFEITLSGSKYVLPANQGVFTPAEVCTPSDWPRCVNWNIPNISHAQVNTFPVVPGHVPA